MNHEGHCRKEIRCSYYKFVELKTYNKIIFITNWIDHQELLVRLFNFV